MFTSILSVATHMTRMFSDQAHEDAQAFQGQQPVGLCAPNVFTTVLRCAELQLANRCPSASLDCPSSWGRYGRRTTHCPIRSHLNSFAQFAHNDLIHSHMTRTNFTSFSNIHFVAWPKFLLPSSRARTEFFLLLRCRMKTTTVSELQPMKMYVCMTDTALFRKS